MIVMPGFRAHGPAGSGFGHSKPWPALTSQWCTDGRGWVRLSGFEPGCTVEDFGYTPKQAGHWARCRQMQLDAIGVLHHTYCQLEELVSQRRWLCPFQRCALEGVHAQRMDQFVGGTGIEQAQVVADKALFSHAVA